MYGIGPCLNGSGGPTSRSAIRPDVWSMHYLHDLSPGMRKSPVWCERAVALAGSRVGPTVRWSRSPGRCLGRPWTNVVLDVRFGPKLGLPSAVER
jgi:hypothetical protein